MVSLANGDMNRLACVRRDVNPKFSNEISRKPSRSWRRNLASPVGPDAQREREHGHGGEAGVLQQLAEDEPEVRKKSLHDLLVGGVALDLLPKG